MPGLKSLLIIAIACALPAIAQGKDRPPNIVFIFIDDMGYADPGCFGNPMMKTPHIDQLAADGIRLTNFYVNSPVCSASRVAVTTGHYNGRWKIHSYLSSRAANRSQHQGDFLPKHAPTTAKALKALGYATAHFGKWHMGGGRDVDDAPLPTEMGFDESLVAFEGLGDRLLVSRGGLNTSSAKLKRGKIYMVQRYDRTKLYADRAIAFVKQNKDKPFYLRFFPNDVHDPFTPRPETKDGEKWNKKTMDDQWKKFFAVLEEMDRHIGRVVKTIDDLGLSKNTLIVFTSDNGPTDWPRYYKVKDRVHPPGFTGPLFGRKWSLYEGGIRMPFIARWKGTIPKGVTNDKSVMAAIDLPATFRAVADVKTNGAKDKGADPLQPALDGVAMTEALMGKSVARPKPIFWQYGGGYARTMPGNPAYRSPAFAMRDGDWKLLMNLDGSRTMLFNLSKDIGEKNNLVEKEPKRVKVMQAAIKAWAAELGYKHLPTPVLTKNPKNSNKPKAPKATTLPSIGKLPIAGKDRPMHSAAKIERAGGNWSVTLNGENYLDLPREHAPQIKGKTVTITATIQPTNRGKANGVIVAHGGNRMGLVVFLRNGKLVATMTNDWKRSTVEATLDDKKSPHAIEARFSANQIELFIHGKSVARAKNGGLLKGNPGDSLQIGADTIQPVGEYSVPNGFVGTISDVVYRTK